MEIRTYRAEDEKAWLRCRLLAFFETAYFDDVARQKPAYRHPSLELVAISEGELVGLLDIELEESPGSVCSLPPVAKGRSRGGANRGGMIWHLAVHPDHRRRGIAGALLREATSHARQFGFHFLEAWTRDDGATRAWYEAAGFRKFHAHLHVYLDQEDLAGTSPCARFPELRIRAGFAHYTGRDVDGIRASFNRVHECIGYRLDLA